MELTKGIVILLNEYDKFSRIKIMFYDMHCNCDSTTTAPFILYSNNKDDNYTSQEMDNGDFLHIAEIDVNKNSDFYFSVVVSEKSDILHLWLGENALECKYIEKLNQDICDDQIVFDVPNEQPISGSTDDAPIQQSLVVADELSLGARKGLRLSYKLNKRLKVALIKLYRLIPNFIKGDYRRRINL